MSRAQDLFAIGERVCAIVVGMNPDCTRISVSTAELEPNDGDMLKDKVRHMLGSDLGGFCADNTADRCKKICTEGSGIGIRG